MSSSSSLTALGSSSTASSTEGTVRSILGQLPIWEGPTTEGALPFDERTRVGRLARNGLTYYLRPNVEPRSRVECSVVVRAGSIDEEDHERGLAHVLEHLCFRARKDESASWSVVRELESRGVKFGSHSNAWTSFEETAYWLHVPSDFAKRAVELLAALVAEVRVSDADVDAERKIVVEEWRQGKDWQQRATEAHFKHSFRGTKLANRLPIGTLEVIDKCTASDVRGFYERYYDASNLAVVLVGDFFSENTEWTTLDDVVQTLDDTFGHMFPPPPKPAEEEASQRRKWPRPASAFLLPLENNKEDSTSAADDDDDFFGREALLLTSSAAAAAPKEEKSAERRVSIHDDAEASMTTVTVSCAKTWRPPTTYAKFREWLLDDLFHLVMNRRLQKLALTPRPPFANASTATDRPVALSAEDDDDDDDNTGRTGSRAVSVDALTVEPTRRDDAPLALEVAWGEIERAYRDGFSKSEVDVAKVELLSDIRAQWLERDQTDSSTLGDECRDHYLLGMPLLGPKVETELTTRVLTDLDDPSEVSNRAAVLFQLESKWQNRVVAVTRPLQEARWSWWWLWPPGRRPGRRKPVEPPAANKIAKKGDTDDRSLFVAAIEAATSATSPLCVGGGGKRPPKEEEEEEDIERFFEPTAPPGRVVSREARALYRTSQVDGAPTTAVELELSNGVTVAFARTALRNDEIVLKAVARGGLSELLSTTTTTTTTGAQEERRRLVAGKTSCALAAEYGPFGVPKPTLMDALGGRKVGLTPEIDSYRRAVNGDCAPDDFETMLCLLHRLFASKLRRDDQRLETFLDLCRENLKHEDKDPRARFAAKFDAVTTCDHAYFARPTIRDLDAVDAPFAATFYDDAFSSGKWRIVLVGALPQNDDDLVALCEKWLGSVAFDAATKNGPPSSLFARFFDDDDDDDNARRTPLRVKFPTDPVDATVFFTPEEESGEEDALKSAVTRVALPATVRPRDDDDDDETDWAVARLRENVALDVAAAVLELRLVDVLRMDAGKIYDASASVGFATADPLDDDSSALEGTLVLAASHDPADRQYIIDTCLGQVHQLRHGPLLLGNNNDDDGKRPDKGKGGGPSARELDAVLEAIHNDRSESLRRNSYWAGAIVRSYLSPRFKGDLADTYAQTIKTRDALTDELRNAPDADRLASLQASFDFALKNHQHDPNIATTTTTATNGKKKKEPRAIVSLLPRKSRRVVTVPTMVLVAAGVAAGVALTLVGSRRRSH